SAALAMTGTVYKLFGSRLLNARNQLDKNLLEMAMQMVYGKDMVTKSGDILIDIQLNKDGSLQSKGRCEQVPDMRSCLSSGAMEQGSS
ncbi:hypothetical protein, partial [Phocaeicola vulgatus]|uniref:hypothetical protein n=1 Tax=Phocaeicola vulgatus TaxID=821 RepID=UPI00321A75F5